MDIAVASYSQLPKIDSAQQLQPMNINTSHTTLRFKRKSEQSQKQLLTVPQLPVVVVNN
jgi:hypothetical protein